MKKHQSKILDFAQKLGSREAGFVFACLGVISQTIHTWFITVQLSSLSGWLQFIQAGIMSLFLNGALLYFTLKGTEQEDPKQARRYRRLVISFASLEVGINLYYWAYKFMIEPWPDINWGRMIIAIPFAIVLPIVLAAYSFEVRVDDYSDNNIEDDTTNEHELDQEKIKELTETIKSDIKTNLQQEYEHNVSNLKQEYEDKIQVLKKELIPSTDSLLVKGLLSDQERVDLEFEWTDKQTGNVQTRVLPNVKLKKIEQKEEETSEIDTTVPNTKQYGEVFDENGVLIGVTGPTGPKESFVSVPSTQGPVQYQNKKSVLQDPNETALENPDKELTVERVDKDSKLHKEQMSEEDKHLLDTL